MDIRLRSLLLFILCVEILSILYVITLDYKTYTSKPIMQVNGVTHNGLRYELVCIDHVLHIRSSDVLTPKYKVIGNRPVIEMCPLNNIDFTKE